MRGTGNMRVPSLTLLAASALQIALGGILGLGIDPIPRLGRRRRREPCRRPCSRDAVPAPVASNRTWTVTLRFNPGVLSREMFRNILKVGALSVRSRLYWLP